MLEMLLNYITKLRKREVIIDKFVQYCTYSSCPLLVNLVKSGQILVKKRQKLIDTVRTKYEKQLILVKYCTYKIGVLRYCTYKTWAKWPEKGRYCTYKK